MRWQNRHVLVTGGASFIGSHLTDALAERGAKVRIVDDLTGGRADCFVCREPQVCYGAAHRITPSGGL